MLTIRTEILNESCKMNIDEVISWVSSVEGKTGKELAYLLKMYYRNRKNRFVNTTVIKSMFNEFFTYGDDVFRSMECDVVTNLTLIK